MSEEISKKTLPKGKYSVVSVDVDTTGRRLIDEIVQLAAYTPKKQYGQYIMPIMNLNPAARQRHQIRVITVGFFRMLKSMQTYKVVKTKTEISALKDFLDWIEDIKASDKSDGVIIIYHEERKFIPYMILEAMKKYGLLDRFFATVKSFADGFSLSEKKCENIKYFTLKQLYKALLKQEEVNEKDRFEYDGNAADRAKLAYEIFEHIAKDGITDITEEDLSQKMHDLMLENAAPTSVYVEALDDQNKCMDRQNSLRPIFVNYFKVTLYHRVKAVTFRRVLADHGYDMEQLHEIWNDKKRDGLTVALDQIEELKTEERTELLELLDCHFDPEKQPIQPIVKKHRSKKGQKENIKPQLNGTGAGGNQQQSPDSTNNRDSVKRNNSRRRNKTYSNQHKDSTLPTSTTAPTVAAVSQ